MFLSKRNYNDFQTLDLSFHKHTHDLPCLDLLQNMLNKERCKNTKNNLNELDDDNLSKKGGFFHIKNKINYNYNNKGHKKNNKAKKQILLLDNEILFEKKDFDELKSCFSFEGKFLVLLNKKFF